MQKYTILEPLVSGDEAVLRRHKTPERTLIWNRSLPAEVQENVHRLTGHRPYRRFMAALHGVWLKAEMRNGDLYLRKESRHAPHSRWWRKTTNFSELFHNQNAGPLVDDIVTRLRHAFDIMSVTEVNVRFFTRLARYRFISPHKFHTDTIYVMVLNYASPCTEFTCSPSLSPVEALPEGSVSIMPPGQIHRSPSYEKGITPFFMAVF